jgi:hypothetical protein
MDTNWPHMPTAKRLGRPRATELRNVQCDLVYRADWLSVANAPKEFSPFTMVQGYFYDWRDKRRPRREPVGGSDRQ